MNLTLLGFIKKELIQTLRDPRMKVLLFIVPVLELSLFGFALSTEIKNVRIASIFAKNDYVMQDIYERSIASGWFIPAKSSSKDPYSLIASGKADVVIVPPPEGLTHVAGDLGDLVNCILDGGACQVGIESTIIALTEAQPIILRAGMIRAEQIASVINMPIATNQGHSKIRTAGMHAAHYAPHTPVRISADLFNDIEDLLADGMKVAVLSFKPVTSVTTYWQKADPDPVKYAHDLYANLRKLDALHCDLILIEQVPDQPAWEAIRDRLKRASSVIT